MDAALEFRLLGEIGAWHGGLPVELGPAQRRAVLAALLADAGYVVPVETLLDRVWGEDQTPGSRGSLYAHLSRLRRSLADLGTSSLPAGREITLERDTCGYRLRVPPDLVDLHRFRELVRTARHDPELDDAARAATLAQAVALWGEPLAGMPGPWAEVTRTTVEREYLDAVLAWGRLALQLGQTEAVLTALAPLATRHPALEPLVELRMAALAAMGRRAEAIACYHDLRERLASTLGTDPSPELIALHDVLRHGRRADPPTQLPGPVTAFTGRQRELIELDTLLDARTGSAVLLVSGTAGVGKTALAVTWAHHVRDRFPDGQLFADLHGYGPGRPADPAEVLAGFLRALGVDSTEIPGELGDAASCFRTLTAGRRLLVVLDNAGDVEQVRPLLPGSPTCAVLVTSRDDLPGLVVRDGARRVALDLLPLDDAARLVTSLVHGRSPADPTGVLDVVHRCARLPLALRIAAERATTRPESSLRQVAAELADEESRLELLDVPGDPVTAVTTVFSWSYRQLEPGTASAFRMLGVHPGPDLTPAALAALTGEPLPAARRSLDVLARVHLVQPTGTGRFVVHDLLRDYARCLVRTVDGEQERLAALTRLLDYQFAATVAVADPFERRVTARLFPPPRVAVPLPEVNDAASAAAWLAAERPGLVRSVTHAADSGLNHQAVGLAEAVGVHLYNGSFLTESHAVFTAALRAARAAGDVAGEIVALRGVSGALSSWGRNDEAVAHLQRALRLAQAGDDKDVLALALINIGMLGGAPVTTGPRRRTSGSAGPLAGHRQPDRAGRGALPARPRQGGAR